MGVASEGDAEKVVGFPFMPVSAGIDICDARYSGIRPGDACSNNHAAQVEIIATEVVDDFQLVLFDPVDTCNGLDEEFILVEQCDSFEELLG